MNLFLCVAHLSGDSLAPTVLTKYEAARCCRGFDLHWSHFGSVSIAVGGDGLGARPLCAAWGPYIAVGLIRLDNPAELLHSIGLPDRRHNDLELALQLIDKACDTAISQLVGDFGVVVWDRSRHLLLAARDAFGVKRLYYRRRHDHVALSSRAELLADSDRYDMQTLLELAAASNRSPDRSIYEDVLSVPPGAIATFQKSTFSIRRFWSIEDFEPTLQRPPDHREYVDRFRELFIEAVRCKIDTGRSTWSQLSGGLDSSSVVSVAEWLAERGAIDEGLGGTVSWVDRWSKEGDERHFSSAVVDAYGVRNELQVDQWWWKEDHGVPPMTDEPESEYAIYARERQTCRIIRDAGGDVLLTGFGSDHYLLGNMFFFADWLVRGRCLDAIREMLRRAAIGRVSFWNLAYQNAILPLLPAEVRRALKPSFAVPAWIAPDVARKHGVLETAIERSYVGRRGHKYAGQIFEAVRNIATTLGRHQVLEQELNVRHPFLYRPLIEFGLRLPPDLCVQPYARKWILREALRGILPEAIRTRVGKGSSLACIVQSLNVERAKCERIIANSVLADLGCVDPVKLRAAYNEACQEGTEELLTPVVYTLALETWLQVRSSRWIANGSNAQRNALLGPVVQG